VLNGDDKGSEVAVRWWRNRDRMVANDVARHRAIERGLLLLNSLEEEERGIM